ncbi:MAG: MaoC family dehydratase [Firmicutes bacterium]|nr:MaoC family dehydratase [Bacillota bacterium]
MAADFVTYDEIQVGDKASFSKTISESDVYQFAGITGDFNELHINQKAAEQSLFKSRVVHGCLADSLVSTVLGMKYPGKGTIFMEKSVSYLKPVYLGDTVTCEITVAEKRERGRVLFDVSYYNQDGAEVIKGTALVLAPRKPE